MVGTSRSEVRKSMIGVIWFTAIIATVGVIVAGYLFKHQDDAIAKANHAIHQANQAIAEGRKADYRICRRQMVNRAILDNFRQADKDRDDRIQPLPLYDCSPNLIGHLPRRLPAGQAMVFRMTVASTPQSELP